MRASLIDTDILSLFFRGDEHVKANFATYLEEHECITFSLLSFYEILSGLRHRDARKQLAAFLGFCQHSVILPLTEHSCSIAAEIYSELRRSGQTVDDIDLLIAGVALANELVVVTRNISHFGRIRGLTVEDWSAQ